MLAAGYAVGGKDPAAAFLTNVRDSPAVVRGDRSGFYRLEPGSRAEVAQALAEAQAELRDLVDVLARPNGADRGGAQRAELRAHRARLTSRIRRLEADLGELDAIFEDETDRAAAPSRAA
jgi:hypothetical protein